MLTNIPVPPPIQNKTEKLKSESGSTSRARFLLKIGPKSPFRFGHVEKMSYLCSS